MLISCHATPTPRTRVLAQRPTRATPATLRSLGHFPSTSSRRAAGFHEMPGSSARGRPHILLSRPRWPDLELDTISHPGPVPSASSIAGWHGVQHSAGCLVDYYLFPASDGARPPLEPSAALPHTAAPLIPLLDSHFLTISVRSFMPAQRQPRPLRRSSQLLAGLSRARGASSAFAAAAAAPRARNRVRSSARLGRGGRAGTVCRWLPRVVGRTVPISHSCQLHSRTCPNSLHTSLRPVRLTFGVFL